jgi:hypothetical protein
MKFTRSTVFWDIVIYSEYIGILHKSRLDNLDNYYVKDRLSGYNVRLGYDIQFEMSINYPGYILVGYIYLRV